MNLKFHYSSSLFTNNKESIKSKNRFIGTDKNEEQFQPYM